MVRSLPIAVILGALAGFGANSVWGAQTGIAVAILVVLIGAVVWVLRRNQQDLHELRRARVSEEVKTALGDEKE